ncbi:linamarin synthase 1 [Selaginella moellendorffii]|nr:linamarin synthase 1 [Selaginella moellendorffii]|eukprot:XP_002974356.2 linamarin synthase 1 [Selaginella moellendorffii]
MSRMAPPHVLAFPFPAQGHINPMILLCRKLASMGFIITFINTRSRHEQEFKKSTAVGDDSFRFVSIPDDCLPKHRLGNNLQMFLNSMEGMKQDLEQLVMGMASDPRRPPVTCVLFDAFIGWSQEFCHNLGIARALLWTSSAACLLLCFHLPLLKHILPAKGRKDIIDFMPGLPSFCASHLPSTLQHEDECDPGFELRIQRFERMKDDVWVFVNSFQEMEAAPLDAARDVNPNCIAVGPLHFDDTGEETQLSMSPWIEDTSCLEWLDKQAPSSVVYVSFGSVATISYSDAQQVYEGLANSGHAFLWVIRLDLLQGSDEQARNDFSARIQQNEKGLIISWAPQVKVLEHESVGALLSHCGWNSTLESLLCLPCFAEQVFNTAWVVDTLKVGVRIKEVMEAGIHASHVEDMVRFVMGRDHCSGDELRRRAKELRHAAKRNVQPNGSSHANLVNFAKALKLHCDL